MDDFINFSSFALKLKNQADPVSQFVYDQLEQSTKDLLSNYNGVSALSEALQGALIEELNEFLGGASIYDETRFNGIALSEKTEQLRAQDPEGEDLVRLNRLLFEDVYPQ